MRLALALVFMLLAACGGALAGGPDVSETRMVQAPPLPVDCTLQLVSVDITQVSFNQTWEVLGYVTLLNAGAQDPSAEPNKAMVRPRACAMGGTAIAVAMSAGNAGGNGLVYMVMHPKPTAASGSVTF
jgi:hypothetical protein